MIQRSKRKRKDEDEDYVDPSERKKTKKVRYNFRKGTDERVIRKTGHSVKHFDNTRYRAVYTCPVYSCQRMLAYVDLNGRFKLTKYGYLSKKNKNEHELRALSIDHFPEPWNDRLIRFEKNKTSNDLRRKSYQDENTLRALCKVCNESHKYEYRKITDYDSDEDDFEPRRTPDRETTYNSGTFSGYRTQTYLQSFETTT